MMRQLPEGVRVIDLAARRVWDRPIALAHYMRRERPVSILSATHLANEAAIVARRIAGVDTRIVVSEHTSLSSELSLNRSVAARVLMTWAGRLTYSGADRIVAVSDGVGDDVAELLNVQRDRITTIYNPVLTPDIHEKAAAPVDHPWLAPGEPPVILGMGRLELQKDFANLIEAFRLVRAHRRCRLLIFGVGSLGKELKEHAQRSGVGEDISLPGFVENPFAYLSKAAVFALSSAWEGLPTVVIECLALGTKIVSTDCPSGPREILAGGRYGRLVPMRDPRSLADALHQALNDESAGTDADRQWLEQFTTEYAIKRYIDVLGLEASARSEEANVPVAAVG
jgi:glycosyltransferase involved in cell wall biosynthesis